MKVLAFNGDVGGCFEYRLRIPFSELKRFGISGVFHPELPNNPWGDDFAELCRFIDQYDLVLVQRCYKYAVVKIIKDACELMGKKLVFETDDDYFNLPPSNPCYAEMAQPGVIDGYKKILGLADAVTVSTKELKDTLYPYNKNIEVFQNNVENVMAGEVGDIARGYSREVHDSNGNVIIPQMHGLVSIPSYWEGPDKSRNRTIRIGYTGTPSHHEDFSTIHHALMKVCEKYKTKVWLVYIGDRYFYDKTTEPRGRVIHVPISQYQLYLYHIRNIDIGIAPLVPNVFNMSKSPIKAIEYGMWGVPAVLPHYITYTRAFKHEENCLTYYNSREFAESLEELIHNDELRQRLGVGARNLVKNNFLESLHAERRHEFFQELAGAPSAKRFEVATR